MSDAGRDDGLFDHSLLVVTGKGGVGKSTVAAALGLAAARRRLRTIVVEVAARDDTSRTLGRPEDAGVYAERAVSDGLHHISIDPPRAMEEYLRGQLRVGPLAGVLSRSRVFTTLTAATPGMRELLTIGKVWELAQPQRRTRAARRYDLVVLDAPATGHGLAMLRAPRTFASVARVGPVATEGRAVASFLGDRRRTAVLAVSTAEEMAVTETLELRARLRAVRCTACRPLLMQLGAPAAHGDRQAAARTAWCATGHPAAGVRLRARPGGAGALLAEAGSMSVAELMAGKRICICTGSGGVGKTTTAAAVAMGLAARGGRVAVVTIDPARRLASSLGLEQLGNEPRMIIASPEPAPVEEAIFLRRRLREAGMPFGGLIVNRMRVPARTAPAIDEAALAVDFGGDTDLAARAVQALGGLFAVERFLFATQRERSTLLAEQAF